MNSTVQKTIYANVLLAYPLIALVLTPTRELAKQVMDVISSLLSDLNHINTSCLIGGEQITRRSQLKQLQGLYRLPREWYQN